MLGTPKPTASLSSSLLARKGQARPAMRPQGFVGLNPATAQEDLGWNDMGEDAYAQQFAPDPTAKPPVLRQIEELDERLSQSEPVPAPQAVIEHHLTPEPQALAAPVVPAAVAPVTTKLPALGTAAAERVAREVAKKSKAAFTLRLDNDRHLRLRLASAVTNRSAQMLVTEALDAFLESIAEVEALARQVGPGTNR
ncbi:hypothetical protein P6144_01255 [Sphingomonas sp. HITSZ_GF]|uniref:hypothetical protein n=1 Tax=Sphingomonas sp. HITSZ_GF TaxID=3037247 RepID=UPI00240E679B|nr:hypothetical protein [Sphingomonas sp. HITSZ_GF]MDG2532262.1 hypothetical protein [Sphingomonas sp. HITSZ_GF]